MKYVFRILFIYAPFCKHTHDIRLKLHTLFDSFLSRYPLCHTDLLCRRTKTYSKMCKTKCVLTNYLSSSHFLKQINPQHHIFIHFVLRNIKQYSLCCMNSHRLCGEMEASRNTPPNNGNNKPHAEYSFNKQTTQYRLE